MVCSALSLEGKNKKWKLEQGGRGRGRAWRPQWPEGKEETTAAAAAGGKGAGRGGVVPRGEVQRAEEVEVGWSLQAISYHSSALCNL